MVELKGAEAAPDKEDGKQDTGLSEAAHEELFAGGGDGFLAFWVEGEQFVEREAGGDPGEGELSQVAREDENENAGDGGGEALSESAMAGIAIQVVDGVTSDHGTEEGDEHQHDGGEGVETETEADGTLTQKTEMNGASDGKANGRDEGEEA